MSPCPECGQYGACLSICSRKCSICGHFDHMYSCPNAARGARPVAAPIVTWSTPHMRAERTWRKIEDELETGTRAEAWRRIREHLGHVRDLINWLHRNPGVR